MLSVLCCKQVLDAFNIGMGTNAPSEGAEAEEGPLRPAKYTLADVGPLVSILSYFSVYSLITGFQANITEQR